MTTALRAPHVVLVGAMGAGKTTVGRPLAAALQRPFRDNDILLFRRTGLSAREIADAERLDTLHAQEASVLNAALDEEEPAVIGAAASTILDSSIRDRLRDEFVVWLRPATTGDANADHDGGRHRPDVDDQSAIRDPLYAQVADLTVDRGACTTDEAVARIAELVTLARE